MDQNQLKSTENIVVSTIHSMDQNTWTEAEIQAQATAFRQLVLHLQAHTEVQNIELMNLAHFCRNCLSKWYRSALSTQGISLTDPQVRELIYGMPYEEWKAKFQK